MDVDAAVLLSSLEAQREHVLGILEGLSEEDMSRPVLPSGWTCKALVHHLAIDVEQFWFRVVMAATADEPAVSGWEVPPGMSAPDVLAVYRAEIAQANQIIETTALDAAPKYWPDYFANSRLADLREVLLHVITETACHAGHLDAARELIDGRTWLIL